MISSDEVRVRDLFEAAYLLCQGCDLADMTITGTNGRKVVTFVLAGDAAREGSAAYRTGRATANVGLLKLTIDRLKDQMFDAIREREREEGIHVARPRWNQR